MSENPNCARCGFPKSEHRIGYSRSRCQFDVIPTSPPPGASACQHRETQYFGNGVYRCAECGDMVETPKLEYVPGASAGREERDIVRVARDEIYRLCVGRGGKTLDGLAGRGWSMSIPVRADDSDEIFTRLANECESLRSALAAERAAGEADKARLDWLEMQVVNVRRPARCGSWNTFWSSPDADDEEDDPKPSDVRKKIDAARALAADRETEE